MLKKGLRYLFILLILIDLGYSFFQHYNKPLDGDMPGGIVPAEDVKKVLSDPFGLSVILHDEFYPNPNRFFSHWFFQNYFIAVPEVLQTVSSPVESVYLSSAILKILVQFSFIILLGYFISNKFSISSFDFILCLVLVTPLFQTNGWQTTMGIIDSSATYIFFYALPLVFLLLFYLPFYKWIFLKQEIKHENFIFIIGILFAIILSFSSPLVPGIVLIISILLIVKHIIDRKQNKGKMDFRILNLIFIYKKWIFLFLFLNFLSLYSLYIGMNNSIFYNNDLPLLERYARLPMGLFQILTVKLGWSLVFGFTLLNLFLINRMKIEKAKSFLNLYKWVFIFSIMYLLLLPLGGYKVYRPFIIRYDTFIPITICLFFLFASSTFLLLKYGNLKWKRLYVLAVSSFLFIFTITDRSEFSKNDCEKTALEIISNSNDTNVILNCNCTILSWEIMDSSANTELIGKLLRQWNITRELKTFSQVK